MDHDFLFYLEYRKYTYIENNIQGKEVWRVGGLKLQIYWLKYILCMPFFIFPTILLFCIWKQTSVR